MPILLAIIAYAILFVSGTAISRNIPKPTPTPTPTQALSTPTISPSPAQPLVTSIPTTANRATHKVLKVIDGDTVNVEIAGKSTTVRLIGIDTPETVDPRKPVQCFGKEASDKAKALLTGKHVVLEADPTQGDKDKYNRLLRYVYLEDGTSVNMYMISEGFAHEYTYQSNPYKYQAEYIAAQQKAREEKKGLWADDACVTVSVTTQPTKSQVVSTVKPAEQANIGSYLCSCSKSCDAMASCEEAYYQLYQCGCSQRDGDNDGVPCESICN